MISANRKIGFRPYHDFQKAEALFPSSCNQRYDRSPVQESHEQVGGRRKIDPVGSGTE